MVGWEEGTVVFGARLRPMGMAWMRAVLVARENIVCGGGERGVGNCNNIKKKESMPGKRGKGKGKQTQKVVNKKGGKNNEDEFDDDEEEVEEEEVITSKTQAEAANSMKSMTSDSMGDNDGDEGNEHLGAAASKLAGKAKEMTEEERERQQYLKSIKVNADDVKFLVNEFEVSRAEADGLLRENDGELRKTVDALMNC
eukprot:TRINITY_DN266_c0_g1_i6.p1 TRINITY_DN266_c0_g1~~TRINITY_DN266_c0_g1_i6.p1  ORF type:complete len:198 (-),score=64.41 TRINITY_DN266_c0_g1_i6:452-1045(-)